MAGVVELLTHTVTNRFVFATRSEMPSHMVKAASLIRYLPARKVGCGDGEVSRLPALQ